MILTLDDLIVEDLLPGDMLLLVHETMFVVKVGKQTRIDENRRIELSFLRMIIPPKFETMVYFADVGVGCPVLRNVRSE